MHISSVEKGFYDINLIQSCNRWILFEVFMNKWWRFSQFSVYIIFSRVGRSNIFIKQVMTIWALLLSEFAWLPERLFWIKFSKKLSRSAVERVSSSKAYTWTKVFRFRIVINVRVQRLNGKREIRKVVEKYGME